MSEVDYIYLSETTKPEAHWIVSIDYYINNAERFEATPGAKVNCYKSSTATEEKKICRSTNRYAEVVLENEQHYRLKLNPSTQLHYWGVGDMILVGGSNPYDFGMATIPHRDTYLVLNLSRTESMLGSNDEEW